VLARGRISLILVIGGGSDKKMDIFGVLVRFVCMRKQSLYGVVGLALAVGAGCATPAPQSGRQVVAEPEPLPIQATLTPEQEKERADARQAYVSCLRRAALYASTSTPPSADEAALVAPMCYAQFLRFEVASTAGMGSRDRRTYDRAGDKRQIEFAGDAVRQAHGLAALTPD
jgi:hypothetical protein